MSVAPIQLHKEYPELDSQVPIKYLSKLQQNYYPWSDAESDEIHDYANKVAARATQVAEEMAVLRKRIKELQLKNAKIQKMKAPYQALASAARRLPDPVLQTIFVHCLPTTRNAAMDESESPLLLGRVCRRWRTIAYSTPELWAKLHIVPPNIPRDHNKRTERHFLRKRDAVQTWLNRSGTCPLSISFVWFGESLEDAIRLNGIVLETLVLYSKRWMDLDIQAPMALLKPLYHLSSSDLPMLKKVSCMGSRGTDAFESNTISHKAESEIYDAIKLLGRATQLCELSLAFNISCTLISTSIPWTQLKALYLESNVQFFFPDFGEMAKILQQCQGLRWLSLKYPINDTDTLPAFEHTSLPITLPNLEILCVDGDQHLDNTFGMSKTLSSLVAPKLHELAIMGRIPRMPDPSDTPAPSTDVLVGVQALLESSRCLLKSLKLETISARSLAFIDCLALCPQLEELTAYSHFCPSGDPDTPRPERQWLDNDLLRLMTPSDDHKTLCPQLTTFDYTLNDVDENIFRHFVESRTINRTPGIAKLKSLRATLVGVETKEVKEWVASIKAQGTDIALIHHALYVPEEKNPSPWTGVSMNSGSLMTAS